MLLGRGSRVSQGQAATRGAPVARAGTLRHPWRGHHPIEHYGSFSMLQGHEQGFRERSPFFEKVDHTITGGREGNWADSQEKWVIASRALPVAKTGSVVGIVG